MRTLLRLCCMSVHLFKFCFLHFQREEKCEQWRIKWCTISLFCLLVFLVRYNTCVMFCLLLLPLLVFVYISINNKNRTYNFVGATCTLLLYNLKDKVLAKHNDSDKFGTKQNSPFRA